MAYPHIQSRDCRAHRHGLAVGVAKAQGAGYAQEVEACAALIRAKRTWEYAQLIVIVQVTGDPYLREVRRSVQHKASEFPTASGSVRMRVRAPRRWICAAYIAEQPDMEISVGVRKMRRTYCTSRASCAALRLLRRADIPVREMCVTSSPSLCAAQQTTRCDMHVDTDVPFVYTQCRCVLGSEAACGEGRGRRRKGESRMSTPALRSRPF